jgi:signal peptidase
MSGFGWRLVELPVVLLVVGVVVGQFVGTPVGLAFVETDSMSPTLEPGDGFVAVPTRVAGEIDEGDVVTFRAREEGNRLTTHRVVAVTDEGYVTRGDANPFTDQQGGEPPVTRDRVAAVALSVDGSVVVVPGVGEAVEASQGVFASLADSLGLDAGPRQLATVLLAALGAAFVLDELLGGEEEGQGTDRIRERAAGHDATRLLVGGVVLVVVVATLSMALSSGATVIQYESVGQTAGVTGGVPAGESREVSVTLVNGGFAPAVAVLAAPGDAPLSRDVVALGPRESTSVTVTVTAPAEPGVYEQRVVQHRYVGVLPVSVLRSLHAVHPWLAVVAVDGVLAFALFGVGRALLGRGRLRLGRERTLPVGLSVRRAVRRLYRDRR